MHAKLQIQGYAIRGIFLGLCLWFGMGESKVQAGCGDHVTFRGQSLIRQTESPLSSMPQKRCSGFLCSERSPLLPSVPAENVKWAGEKLIFTCIFSEKHSGPPLRFGFDEAAAFLCAGYPGDILDPPRF